MNSDYYSVKIGDVTLAKEMTLGTAVIFVEALFQKWDKDPSLSITIVKEERPNG